MFFCFQSLKSFSRVSELFPKTGRGLIELSGILEAVEDFKLTFTQWPQPSSNTKLVRFTHKRSQLSSESPS
jgi:hypothetical protein